MNPLSKKLLAVFALISAFLHILLFNPLSAEFRNIGFIISMGVFITGSTIILVRSGQFKNKWVLSFLLPIVVFLGSIFFYQGEFIQAFSPLAVYILIAAYLVFAASEYKSYRVWALQIFDHKLLVSIRRAIGDSFAYLFSAFKFKETENKIHQRVLRGALLAIPFLIIFFLLFSSADAMFSSLFSDFVIDKDINDIIVKLIKVFIFFVGFGTTLFLAVGPYNKKKEKEDETKPFDPVVVSTMLIFINSLFAIFNYIQIRYVLFGQISTEFLYANNITYADYVHQGFYQLVIASIISALIIMVLFLYKRSNKFSQVIWQVVLALQTIIVAFSGLKRLYAYKEAYGFTVLRLHVEWFMYFIIAIFIFSSLSFLLRMKKATYVWTIAALSVSSFALITALNAEKISVRENFERYHAGDEWFDPFYNISNSSIDVLPELVEFKKSDELTDPELIQKVDHKIEVLKESYISNKEMAGWRYENIFAKSVFDK